MASKAENFASDLDRVMSTFEILAKMYKNIEEEWGLVIFSTDLSTISLCRDARLEISNNNNKVNSEEMFCVVFGGVSTGKSTLINAMLRRNILPNDCCHTTNSFVEIRKSDDHTEYIIFPDRPGKSNISEIERVDRANKSLRPGSRVKLFLSGSNADILNNNFIIVDTPGIDSDHELDATIHDFCTKSGILILVVNSVTDFSETEKNFLLKHKTIFSNFELIIVFNRWDKIREPKKVDLKVDFTKMANDYLCDALEVKVNRDDENIFFLSSKKRLMNETNGKFDDSGDEQRNDLFENFLTTLRNKFVRIYENRRLAMHRQNSETIELLFTKMTEHRISIKERLTEKVEATLSQLSDVNTIINGILDNIFKQNYEFFFERGVNDIKLIESSAVENAAAILNTFISEQITVLVESSKIVINEFIMESNAKDKEDFKKILEKLYFSHYFNEAVLISVLNLEELSPAFRKIIETINTRRIYAIAGIAVVGATVAAALGFTAPVIAKIGVGGTSAGIGSWYTLFRERFQRMFLVCGYDDHESHIILWWGLMKAMLLDTYTKFVEHIPTTINLHLRELDTIFTELEKCVDQYKETSVIIG